MHASAARAAQGNRHSADQTRRQPASSALPAWDPGQQIWEVSKCRPCHLIWQAPRQLPDVEKGQDPESMRHFKRVV